MPKSPLTRYICFILEQQIEREQFPQELAERYLEFLKGYLIPKYAEFIGKEIQTAYRNPTLNTDRIFSTVMSRMQISGFRIRNTAIRIPVSCLTVNR
jgi:predicted Ser/Thr protein kinase